MFSYNVMLNGEDEGKQYFTIFEIAALSQSQAEEIALSEATRMGLKILGIEDVEFKQAFQTQEKPGLLKIYGKTYFEAESQ